MERLLEDVSYNASELDRVTVTINAAYVDQNLAGLAADEDLSRYIL
jgi:ATP-dependent HslUV protease ATP-binding subunit HslU